MRAVSKDAAGFCDGEGLIVETQRIDDRFCKAGERFRGTSENLLRDGVSGSGSFDYDGKKFRKNGVRTLGDALENRVPVLSFGRGSGFFGAKNFFAERGRRAEMVASAQSGFDGAAANVVGAAWIANPRAPSSGARRLSGGIAATRCRACASDDDDSGFVCAVIGLSLSESRFEGDFDVGDDANGSLRKRVAEIGDQSTRDAWTSGSGDSRADRTNAFGFLAGFTECAQSSVFEREGCFR